MRCDEFENRLNELLDARQNPAQDRTLVSHAAACGDCREQLSACAALLRGLHAAPAPQPSPQFAHTVVARLQPTAQRSLAPAVLLWGGGLALSAALLLALTLAFWPRDAAEVIAQPQPARPQPKATGRLPGGLALAAARPRVQPASAVAAPAANPGSVPAANPGLSPAEVLPGAQSPAPDALAAYRVSLEQLTSQLPSSIPPLETVDQYAPGFRPLRQSFEAAFDALLRTMPGQHDPHPAAQPQAHWPGTGGELV